MSAESTRWMATTAALMLVACGEGGSVPPSSPVAGSGAMQSPPMGISTGGTMAPAVAGQDPTGGTGSIAGTAAPMMDPPDAQVPPATTPDAGVADASQPLHDAATTEPDSCDRACLLAIMQGYIDALIANDPSQLPVAATLKYTENGVEAKLGETVWKTATALMPEARLDFADPPEGQVASQFVFNEGSTPVIYQVRLKVVAGEITEIESMAVRRVGAANGFFNPAAMKPEAVFLQEIDAGSRMSREELERVTQLYLDYLEGDKRGSEVPFDSGCKRYENGQVTASGLSSFNIQSWSFSLTRRILVIDEEAGITWGMFPFTQAATTLVVGEAFKIIDGKIMMIQAVMANQPAKTWD